MLLFWLVSQLEVILLLLVNFVFLITSYGLLSFVQPMRKYIKMYCFTKHTNFSHQIVLDMHRTVYIFSMMTRFFKCWLNMLIDYSY
jgi:hypothetical protein